jgi:Fur family transcriptional regulator, ferric uptake regulator
METIINKELLMCEKQAIAHRWMHKHFRGHGYRITTARKAIVALLADSDMHLSAEDIYQQIHSRYPRIGFTTIYRTLELLVRIGAILKLEFGDRRARYEMADKSAQKPHHHHLVCLGCRRIIDYTDFIKEELEFLRRAERGLSRKYQFAIASHVIQFYGKCRECSSIHKENQRKEHDNL